MYKNHSVAVVIPAYRAAGTIRGVIASLPAFVDQIIVVNDASPDKTDAVVRSIADARITLLTHVHNQGVGGAMVTGFQEALRLSANVVVKVDSDGQMDTAYLPVLLDRLIDDGFNYAKGNRFYDTQALGAMPRARFLGNVALTFFTKLASGYWDTFDVQNGYLAITGQTLARLDLASLDRTYFFENSMLIQLNVLSASVADVPMSARYGEQYVSSMHLSRILIGFPLRLARGLAFRIWYKYCSMNVSAIAPLLGLGLPMTLFGVVFGAYAWMRSILYGVPATAGTVMLAALPLVLGSQMLLQALQLDIVNTPRSQGAPTRLPSHSPPATPSAPYEGP